MSAPVSVPAIAVGLALLVAYWIWVWAFFAKVRPRIMAALGRHLRVKVAESTEFLDAGTYNVEKDDAPLAKHGAVWGVDVALTVAGTLGVAALVFVPAFLVADSGALLPIEAELTGRGAALTVPAEVTWPATERAVSVRIEIRNSGREPLARCQVRTADYRVKDGYLHGSTPFVDLPVGAARRVDLGLEAQRVPDRPIGVRLKLECANDRLATARLWLRPGT